MKPEINVQLENMPDWLGKIVMEAVIRKGKSEGVYDHFVDYACERAANMHPKTFRVKLNDWTLWTLREMKRLQDYFKDENLAKAVNELFRIEGKK